MTSGFRLFLDIAPIAFLLMVVTFMATFPYRKEHAAKPLLAIIVLVAWLIATSVAELLVPMGSLTVLCAKLEWVSYLYIPIAWLSFCLRYTGIIRLSDRRVLIVAAAAPLSALAVVFTNELHGLLWTRIIFRASDGLSVMRPEHGPLFWMYVAYAWGLTGFGSLMVIRSFFSGQRLYYRQSLWILAGSIMPGITNLINLTGVMPGLEKDFTPIGYTLSALCFLAGIYLHKLLWILPVARSVLMQELTVGIIALDSQGWIVDHNRKADELLGLDTVSVGHRAADFPSITAIVDAAGFIPGVDRRFTKSGILDWNGHVVSWTVQPSAPATNGSLIMLEDVTDRTKLEREMEAIRHELINREKLATVGRITAGLAHEINNPVGYLKSDVRSLTRLIERTSGDRTDADTREIVAIAGGITEGLERIEGVVRSLLSFSREERIDSPFEPYNLYAGIDATIDIMRYELKGTIGIQRDLGEVPLIFAQKGEINQVLLNILSNACYAIRERGEAGQGAGIITIRTGSTGQGLWCEIENNGVPIAAENRNQVFDLFFTTKKARVGTGLGLNICRDIVENHHSGKLSLVSLDPVIFRIELPIHPRKAEGGERT